MRLLTLLDFAARDLAEFGHDLEATLKLFEAPQNAACKPLVVCVDEYEERRLRARSPIEATQLKFLPQAIRARRAEIDGILNLLGTETVGSHAGSDKIQKLCVRLSLSYYGPLPRLIPGMLRSFDNCIVISVVAAAKHAGKTLITQHLASTLADGGWTRHVISVERSLPSLGGVPNPRSDYTRFVRENVPVTHILRTGEMAAGIAAIAEHVSPPEVDVVIIDNSGGSIAPIVPDIIIGVGKNHRVELISRQFPRQPLQYLLCCGKQASNQSYTIRVRSIAEYGNVPSREAAAGLFLHRCLSTQSLSEPLRAAVRVRCRDEAELRRAFERNRSLKWIVTDDYQGSRYRSICPNVLVLRVEVETLNWSQLLASLSQLNAA